MTAADRDAAFAAAARAVESVCAEGADLLVLGEMGIGNTTAASALAAALGPLPLAELVGAGTGLDAARLAGSLLKPDALAVTVAGQPGGM